VGYFRALLDSRITHDGRIGAARADLGAGDLERQPSFGQEMLDDDFLAEVELASAVGVAIEARVGQELQRIGRRHRRTAGVVDQRVR
jgi:hypothetical protein